MAGPREVSFVVRIKDAGSATLHQIGDAAGHTIAHLFSLKEVLKDLAGAAAAISIAEIVKSIVELGIESDKTFRTIAANLPTFTEGLKELKEGIDGIADASGRSLEEIEHSAIEISKLGVESAEELKQQLEAATVLADATGESVDDSAKLLIQMRREFHLTGDQALEMAAKLKSASLESRIGVLEMFDAFRAATPIFEKFDIDADTGIKAIAALAEHGYTTSRAIRSVLGEMPGASAIKQIADQAHIAGDALEDLERRAKETRDGADRAWARDKSAFVRVLEDLGIKIVPKITASLKDLKEVIEAIGHINVPNLFKLFEIAADQSIPGSSLQKSIEQRIAAWQSGQLFDAKRFTVTGSMFGPTIVPTFKQSPPTGASPPDPLPPGFTSAIPDTALGAKGRFTLPPTKEEIAKAEEAKKKLEALRLEMAALLETTESGKTKSQQFADAIEKYQVKAREAGKSTTEIAADVAQLNGVLDALARQEAAKQIADDAKEAREAFAALNDAIANLSGDPLEQLDAQLQSVLEKLDEQRAKIQQQRDRAAGAAAVTGIDTGQVAALDEQLRLIDDGVARIRESFKQLRAAIAETTATEKEFGPLREQLEQHRVTADQLVMSFDQLSARAKDVEAKMKAATDPKVVQEYGKELEFIRSLLALIDKDWGDMFAPIEKSKNKVLELAESWATVARSVVAAVQAIGGVDDKTAALLQNVVNAGEGIAKAVASGGTDVGADVQAITSIAALTKSIFGLGKNSAEARQRAAELDAQIDKLFQGIADQLSPTKGNSLAEQIARAQQDFVDKRNTIERDLGGKKNQTEREKALDKLTADEAAYIEMLKQEDAIKQQQLQEDYRVRELRAKGLDLEADALEFAEHQQREYSAAVKDGADEATLAALKTAQAAEMIHHAVKSQLDAALTTASQGEQIHHVDTSTTPGAVQAFADRAEGYSAIGGALGDLFHGLDLSHLTPQQIAGLDQGIQDLFDQIKSAPESVDTAGLSIDDFIQALLDLSGAAANVANTIASAAQKISEAENEIAISDDILGTSPTASIGEYAGAYGIDLSAFDLSTGAGRDAAIGFLQDSFKSLDKTAADYGLQSHEIQNLVQRLRGLTFDATGPGGGGLAPIPAMTDSYQQATTGTVEGISSGEAEGILGLLNTISVHTAALPDMRELLSQWVSNKTLYGGAAPGAWQSSLATRLGGGIGSAIGSSLGTAAASAMAGSGAGGSVTLLAPIYIDGKQVAEAIADAYLDPGTYQALDRSLTQGVNRGRAGAGLARTK